MSQALYLRPTTLADALQALGEQSWSVLAGGTDFYPARLGKPLKENVLDISAISESRSIRREGEYWRIPMLATWSDLMADKQLPGKFDGLKRAAREVGGVQIQNVATICGNLCNASPAADGIPNLLALDAQVELRSARGTRVLPVSQFVTGNRQTSRTQDELVTGLLVPESGHQARSSFLKLGARKYLVISIVMVAAMIELDEAGNIAVARLAVGACGPVAKRLPELESDLSGKRPAPDLADLVSEQHLKPLSPIDDVRGTAQYRLDAALTLLRRSLAELCR